MIAAPALLGMFDGATGGAIVVPPSIEGAVATFVPSSSITATLSTSSITSSVTPSSVTSSITADSRITFTITKDP